MANKSSLLVMIIKEFSFAKEKKNINMKREGKIDETEKKSFPCDSLAKILCH